jgi:hypothetical protein
VNNHFEKLKNSLCIFVAFGLLAAALIAPVASDHFIRHLADFINHLASITQAKLALQEGQFPIRIAPLEQQGFGYPLYQFYSPTTYTIAGLIYLLITPTNLLNAYKLTAWIGLYCAGFYMYRLAYYLVKSKPAAILAGLVYVSAPYYIIMLARLGDLSETLALGFTPMAIFYSLQRYRHPQQNWSLLFASLAWFLLLTSHIVTFFYTSFFSAIFLVWISFYQHQGFYRLIQVAIAYSFACLLAMWYLAPVQQLAPWLVISNTFESSLEFISHATLLSYLFSPSSTIYPHYLSALDMYHPSIGWPILFGAALCVYASFNKKFLLEQKRNPTLMALVAIFLLAFLMVWSPFNFWQWLPAIFRIGQYSWRYLSQVIWIGSILFAFALAALFKNKLDVQHIIIGALLIIVMSSPWQPVFDKNSASLEKLLKNPRLIYSRNAYLIDFEKHTQWVTAIDNMGLYPLINKDELSLKTLYYFPKLLTDLAYNPVIHMQGSMAKDTTLQAVFNSKSIVEKNIKAGDFSWDIALKPILNQYENAESLALQFNSTTKHTGKITIQQLQLTGFIKPTEVLDLTTMQTHCKRSKASLICQIQVPDHVKIVELPVLYYPELLTIHVNNKLTNYHSLLYQSDLITTIKPEAGKLNTIEIQFAGLAWANWTSFSAWCLWLWILILSLKDKFRPCSLSHIRLP